MKRLHYFSIFIFVILFTSCIKDLDDNTIKKKYFTVGIYHPDKMILTSDFGKELIILNSSEIKSYKQLRALIYFFIEEEVDEKTIKVKFTNIYDISSLIIHIDENNQDSLKRNDPIEKIDNPEYKSPFFWVAQDYLTIKFDFLKFTKTHNFFFSKNPEDQEEGKIVLKFHHNANNDKFDPEGNAVRISTLISIPISEFKEIYPEKDSVEIKISYFTDITTSMEETVWYKF